MKIFVIGGSTVGRDEAQSAEERAIFEKTFKTLGADLRQSGHDLIVCSPYTDSVDHYSTVGFATAQTKKMPYVRISLSRYSRSGR